MDKDGSQKNQTNSYNEHELDASTYSEEWRYREILPFAYLASVVFSGKTADFVNVGLCVQDIAEAEKEGNPAHRIGTAEIVLGEIVSVSEEPFAVEGMNGTRYRITYLDVNDDMLLLDAVSPLTSEPLLGKAAREFWGQRHGHESVWKGSRLNLYLEKPKVADDGYLATPCCVYAEQPAGTLQKKKHAR